MRSIFFFVFVLQLIGSKACANGEVAPFMGHNAFLRWRAIQDAAFIDPADGKEKIWSESNVSEDFDMALRLMLKGYIVRCVALPHFADFLLTVTCSTQLGYVLKGPFQGGSVSQPRR